MQNLLVWQVCYFSHEACVGRDIHATWMCHSGVWRQCRIKSLESLRPMGQYESQSDPKTSHTRTCVVCRQKNCYLHSRWRHPRQEGDGLSSEERRPVVDESSSIVLSHFKRECVSAQCQKQSERVRRLAECALQKGLECSRRATHKWLCQALKGGAGPAHRWCGKEDALPELPRVIRDRQGNFTADPQCVSEMYAQEWKREWEKEDAIGFSKEIPWRQK